MTPLFKAVRSQAITKNHSRAQINFQKSPLQRHFCYFRRFTFQFSTFDRLFVEIPKQSLEHGLLPIGLQPKANETTVERIFERC